MVIVDAQRMGPATGGATTVAQSDVQFLRWGTSGGFPVIVLAPTDVAECYSLTRRAFDLAERFRVPVFVATDKETVLSRATVDVSAWEEIPVRKRATAPADRPFVPYPSDAPRGVPAMSPIGGPHLLRFTTSSHDEQAYLSKSAAQVDELNRRLAAKVEGHLDEIELAVADLDKGAETLIVAYGITARAVKEAVVRARREGASLSMLTVHSLWPVPEGAILRALAGVKRVLVPELNLGQYVREVERLAGEGAQVRGLGRVDGELITPDQILAAVAPEVAA
jgi:2-oxoglutarate ferredoxin oxidoreductase subunit alpha